MSSDTEYVKRSRGAANSSLPEPNRMGSEGIEDWPTDLEIEGLSASICERTGEIKAHVLFVTEMTMRLARLAGVTEDEIHYVHYGALLHDIGKVGIPEEILLKAGSLTSHEWELVRRHPLYAQDLLYPVVYLRPCLPIPLYHHERWDGDGYPRGLKEEEIPLPARLFAVVDIWDALSSDHPYRQAWPVDRVMDYLRKQSGGQFDPGAIELFMSAISKGQVPASGLAM